MAHGANASGVVAFTDEIVRDFERIYREQISYVLKILVRFGLSRTSAEDVAHDVFEVFLLKLHTLEETERHTVASMRAFLFRIAWNRASNYRRLHSVVREKPTEFLPETPTSDRAFDIVLAQELARDLAKLSSLQTAIFIGFEVFGMTAPELAEEQHIEESEVRRILDEARKSVRRSTTPPGETTP
jgi:RNA polymerase sigma-70 factor, ECF subfamily